MSHSVDARQHSFRRLTLRPAMVTTQDYGLPVSSPFDTLP
jgi:hypothetical protein